VVSKSNSMSMRSEFGSMPRFTAFAVDINGTALARSDLAATDKQAAEQEARQYPGAECCVYCFSAGRIAPSAPSDKGWVSLEVASLGSEATQSPAQSFVPLTVPTSLQPVGTFGLTCTNGLLPMVGDGL
jgi:hypothetical protein